MEPQDVDLAKFAAVTLHSKVHGQYNQLPAETIKLLLDKLLCHVIGEQNCRLTHQLVDYFIALWFWYSP